MSAYQLARERAIEAVTPPPPIPAPGAALGDGQKGVADASPAASTAPATGTPSSMQSIVKNLTDLFPAEAMTFYLAIRGFADAYGGDSWLANWVVLILLGALFNVGFYTFGLASGIATNTNAKFSTVLQDGKVRIAFLLSMLAFAMWSVGVEFNHIGQGTPKLFIAIAIAALVPTISELKRRYL